MVTIEGAALVALGSRRTINSAARQTKQPRVAKFSLSHDTHSIMID